ncbi:AraC family transcriptional regulator [Aestuariivirga sp.]|uniref:AraC family transcriptional regulator n=1 Tax=Aestuariivirga sp. TaxID=2650926 RepID=UPI0025C01049|nr:AraC family transcriptional regulator [Aestuariivirga sp.]MCA3554279.1 AraC family transcriptional regulator [Aestuariivirga sp.]
MPEIVTLRSGGLRSSIELIRELGHDPVPLVLESGLTLDIFEDPETEMPLTVGLKLLNACVRTSGLPHFGLMAGARNSLATLGLFGHIAQTAPNIQTAINDLIGFLSVHDRFAKGRLAIDGETAALEYAFDYPSILGAELATDITIAAVTKMLRALCGDEWLPTRVRLPRARPANAKPFVDTLGADVVFGSKLGAIEFPALWLTRALPGANQSLRAYFGGLVRLAQQSSDSEVERVRRIVRVQLFGGRPTAERAAAVLGIHRRSMARRLSAEGLTFKELVRDLRFEMACDMLAKSGAPMAQIAEMLGYSDQTVFSRAFSRHFGHPPSHLRKTQR